jgi:hypothetical protein
VSFPIYPIRAADLYDFKDRSLAQPQQHCDPFIAMRLAFPLRNFQMFPQPDLHLTAGFSDVSDRQITRVT